MSRLVPLLLLGGCAPAASAPGTCRSEAPAPYPASSPYLGVHGGPRQNDVVPCNTADAYTERWRALEGTGIAQPNTFSPDGTVTYVTTSAPTPEACTVHALSMATGETLWCVAEPDAFGGSVVADAAGDLYLTASGAVVSLDADGQERWRHPVVDAEGQPALAYGVHFTPAGHVVTVTAAGELVLLDRASGRLVASLDVPGAFGFPRPPASGSGLDLGALLPEQVRDDFARVFGSIDPILSIFAAVSDRYTDNTVGVGADGSLYVIGYGEEPGAGALAQVRVEGSAEAPELVAGWFLPTVAGSASSPSISPDGRWVKVLDGNSFVALLDPRSADANARIADIDSCDANRDADADPRRCAPAFVVPLASGPAVGASPVLDDAEHYLWDVQLADLLGQDLPDLTRLDGDEIVWATSLPGDAQWTSVLTLSDRHVIGTMTRLTDSGEALAAIELPGAAESEVVVVDRATGEVTWSAPVSDDSTSTVTVGPDGGLYVTMLGLVHGFAVDTEIVGGVVAFEP